MQVKDLQEGQETLKVQVKDLQEGQETLKVQVKDLQEGQETLKFQVNDLQKRVGNLEVKVDKQEKKLDEGLEILRKIDDRLDVTIKSNLAQILSSQTETKRKLNDTITTNMFEHKRFDYRIKELEIKKNRN